MKYLIFIGAMLAAVYAKSQEMVTDRPDQTESPVAVNPGEVQIETGYLSERYGEKGSISVKRRVLPTTLFRVGLVDRLELRVVSEFARYTLVDDRNAKTEKEYTGFENMQLGFKYQLNPSDQRLIVGLMAHLVVPSGSEGLNNKYFGLISRVNFNYELDDNKSLGLNLGYNHLDWTVEENEIVEGSNGSLIYTLTYCVGLGEKFAIYAEVFGDYLNMVQWQNKMDMGFTYLLKENIQLDYSFGWGFDVNMNYQALGVSFRLPK